MSKLVIVESPSKSKTLKKYLGADYDILASYGHVRDLEPKTGAVDTENFSMKYQIIERNAKHVEAIVKAAKKADEVLLATDPDREGEAISWHISEILKERKVKTPMKRVAFYEITESAVQDAVRNPREIATDLVDAQQARRALDYLVGFNLSPLLWRKISPGLSAGRVQSPALRMIVERELEIEAFVPREYWTLHLDSHKGTQSFIAKLTHFKGEKLEQFTVEHEARSKEWLAMLEGRDATVMRIEKKRRARHPGAPFTTSTLQQAGVRQLGMTTDRVMRTAQQLYEGIDLGEGPVGLITYMRTDSVNLAQEAITDIRKYVGANFDKDYLPPAAIAYKAKTKNAQEAHEAVRPTSVTRTPEAVKPFLSHDQARLYELIWKRTVACQMTPAQFDTVAADITVGEGTFRATGQTLAFAGFLAVYQDDEDEEGESKLPALAEGETLPVDKLYGEQHFTQPPPRYTEASLVKALEEYGIGRPSTYASIISTLQDREYVVLEKKRFQPTDIGRLVNCFLTRHFGHYVDYDFTAKLEDKLDDVSNGKRVWTRLLGEFWSEFDSDLKAKQDVERGCPISEALPQVRQAAVHAGKQARPLHRLLRLPGMRLHASAARRHRRGRQHPGPGSGHGPGRETALRAFRSLRADRRHAGRQEGAEAAPRLVAEGHSAGKRDARTGAEIPLAAARSRPPPDHRPADRRQQRPLRSVSAARRQVQVDSQDRQRVRNRSAARA